MWIENSKVCNTCFIKKELNMFGKEKTCKDGYRSKCKKCCKPGKQLHYQLNKEKYKKAFNEFMLRQKQKYN
jgi:superfamily II helicase